ncbi:hypothetical protein EJ05DRAFT_480940 [Pseudovirgaria hyperparasitica]|uniref:Sodium/calcium exchanger membrane region domain-containing protein n=1 Tax=Pseudovirgaria hyperparasitica TaxID=470096 RepID=A0A6A6VQ67_9PEZI|nr:uncharacterized protein EJ05DRAFT_480940 [Pseudovirgaria hyperparasitica]KAF2752788.1 hypothetical protein EJ05DRAFT_480940 [Pseudovirgaria hyperparasitica]
MNQQSQSKDEDDVVVQAPARLSQRKKLGRRREYSTRAIWLVLLCVTILASSALVRDNSRVGDQVLGQSRIFQRDQALEAFKKHKHDDEASHDCHLVHEPTVKDKCAFVQSHCADEAAGLIPYLEIYYCKLPHAQPFAFIVIVVWLGLLFSTIGIAASDFFCVNLSTISNMLGLSENVAGVTLLALGNGSPDVFSTFAAMNSNSGSLAVGELVGAAGFITAVVAGAMALTRPFKVAKKSFVRDVGFFIVASSFALIFLRDGILHLWECIAMVVFYLIYVAFVVLWHMHLTRRNQARAREAAGRSHFVGAEDTDIHEPYRDDDDDGEGGRPIAVPEPSAEDFSNLECGGAQQQQHEFADDDEETRERWLGDINKNFRLIRPKIARERRSTVIRPSLVGALEFQAVYHSLQKSRNIRSIPITIRRYSDDPVYTSAQQQEEMSNDADPGARPIYTIDDSASQLQVTPRRMQVQNRERAVSVNDIDSMRLDVSALRGHVPQLDVISSSPGPTSSSNLQVPTELVSRPPSPSISVTPPVSAHPSRSSSPATSRENRLAPPTSEVLAPDQQTRAVPSDLVRSPTFPTHAQSPSGRNFPKLPIPGHSPQSMRGRSPTTSPIPTFAEHSPGPTHSLRLPPPSLTADSFPQFADLIDEIERPNKPLKWWPYKILPPPGVLVSTLFPTLYRWQDKNIWAKLLGIVSAPSVFLLTITLPVVEEKETSDKDAIDVDVPTLTLLTPELEAPRHPHYSRASGSSRQSTINSTGLLDPNQHYRDNPSTPDGDGNYFAVQPNSYGTLSTDAHHAHLYHAQPIVTSPSHPHMLQSPEQLPTLGNNGSELVNWNRWLVIVQVFTAPFFVVVICWANLDESHPRKLILPALISLLFSLLALLALVLTTTPTRPPTWHKLLTFLGFAVAIAWISTIANEVVGVLKWLGIVLNISDAILGLTIFAVGNSLGDLVADITVARLGYPVMALSACFGGPMLNILLGIGVSGSWITVKRANRHLEKHPGTDLRFKPYTLEVSSTLLISGATLVVTLVGLLIAVPARRWRMDKVIGWGLIGVWTVSTALNVVAEVIGWSKEMSDQRVFGEMF